MRIGDKCEKGKELKVIKNVKQMQRKLTWIQVQAAVYMNQIMIQVKMYKDQRKEGN